MYYDILIRHYMIFKRLFFNNVKRDDMTKFSNNAGKIRMVVVVILVEFFISCTNVNEPEFPVLSVDVSKMNPPSVFDIFEKIEIIPLETTNNSLIGGQADNIDFFDNHYYVLDGRTDSFYCFDEHGRFVRKIGNKGAGPEEYFLATNFAINKSNHVVELLNPFGIIYTYELSGKFVSKTQLPDLVPNYQEIMLLNDSIRILRSSTHNNENQLYAYSNQSNTIVNSFYKENPAINGFNLLSFYHYNNGIYFYKPLKSAVFKIDQHGFEVAYSWDFGALNPEKAELDSDITSERIAEMYMNAQIKGIYNIQYQNDDYYYTLFRRYVNQDLVNINVLYDKRTNRKIVFDNFKEGLRFFPIFWCDNYVLATSSLFRERNVGKTVDPMVLDEANSNILNTIEEDDNPFILKYYFK